MHAPEFSVTLFATMTMSLFELTTCLIIVHDILCFIRTYVQEHMQEDICMMMPFDHKYQNPSGFACFRLIRAIVIFAPLGIQNLNKKGKTNWSCSQMMLL